MLRQLVTATKFSALADQLNNGERIVAQFNKTRLDVVVFNIHTELDFKIISSVYQNLVFYAHR